MQRVNLRIDAKGKAASGYNREGESTEAMLVDAHQQLLGNIETKSTSPSLG